jgi:DNA gyrase subunit B
VQSERNLAAEMDELRAELRELTRLVKTQREGASGGDQPEAEQRSRSSRGGVSPRAHELEALARARGHAGMVSYYGYYGSSNRSSMWSREEVTAEMLLGQGDERVGRVLTALASRQRLAVLKAILERPGSAAELVERLGMGTTGQVYHHLNVLQAADLIHQEGRGQFVFTAYRVQGFLMLLAGVMDLLDPRYSAGTWEEGDAAPPPAAAR